MSEIDGEVGAVRRGRGRARWRALVALVAGVLVVPAAVVTVAAAEPSPDAPALVAAAPPAIPDDLWDVPPPDGTPGNYAVMEGAEGDEVSLGSDFSTVGQRVRAIYDPTFNGSLDRLSVFATSDVPSARALLINITGPGGTRITEPGFHSDLTLEQVNPPGTYLEVSYFDPGGHRCGFGRPSGPPPELTGWLAIDQLEVVEGKIVKLDLRLEESCGGQPPVHAEVHIDDTPSPRPIPVGLWDANPEGVTGDYLYIDGQPGDGVTGGVDHLITRSQGAGRQVALGYLLESFTGDTDGTVWAGAFGGFEDDQLLGPGLYPNAASVAGGDPSRPYLTWWEMDTPACPGVLTGWFAIDDISWMEEGSGPNRLSYVTKLDLRFEQSCDGGPPVRGKLHVADRTPPGPAPLRVPEGLWSTVYDGPPNFGWAVMEGAEGDPVTGGGRFVYRTSGDGLGAGLRGDELGSLTSGGSNPFFISVRGPDGNPPGVGYYPLATGPDDRLPGRASIDVQRRDATSVIGECPGEVSGWVAIDHIAAVGEEVRQLDLRFEQRCGDALPMHGQIHLEIPIFPTTTTTSTTSTSTTTTTSTTSTTSTSTTMPTTTTTAPPPVLSRPPGPPFGSFDLAAAVPGGVKVGGWAIDPDTAGSIPVHVYVDGKGTAMTADSPRPDVGAAFSGYGDAHGFSATIPATPGSHQVCAYGINVGVGGNVLLGCRTVTVMSGSPFGSLDVARQGPSSVVVGGWALDPDTTGSIPVHVYVDGKGTAITADASRPDVGSLHPGYGPAHGFSATISTTPGTHQVCAYGINTGAGGNTLLGCSTVTVPTGSPIGTIDVARGGPGWVSVGGWALDADTGDPIAVHVYVDSKGTAITAGGSRPDVGAYFFGWGDAHGYATTISAPPGVHDVCVYGINVGPGGNTLLGCRTVTVG